ncbi:hypothetical protein ACNKHM_21780 [Shigella sonnei]
MSSCRPTPITLDEQKHTGLRDYRWRWTFLPVKPRCAWRQGRLPKYLARNFGIEIASCLTQIGNIPLEIKDWSQVEQINSSARPGQKSTR